MERAKEGQKNSKMKIPPKLMALQPEEYRVVSFEEVPVEDLKLAVITQAASFEIGVGLETRKDQGVLQTRKVKP